MPDTIVVPLDGSTLAEQALPLAVTLADKTGDTIMLLRVIAPTREVMSEAHSGDSVFEKARQLRANMVQSYFNSVEPRLRQAGVETVTRLQEGHPAKTIAAIANDASARFVVMTTHGQTGLARWSTGSVADGVLRRIEKPLFLLRPREPFTVNITQKTRIANILVPLDGSLLAESALPWVRELAHLFGSTVHLFRVESLLPMALASAPETRVEAGIGPVWSYGGAAYLEEIAIGLAAEGIAVRTTLKRGMAANAILEHAISIHADLIAMATHGRTGLRRTVQGSVTDRVARASHIPVCIVPPQEAQVEKGGDHA